MNLRKAAQGQACVMCGSTGTTVLHHLRIGNPGMGRKPPDWAGVELCSGCHDWIHHEGIADYKSQLLAYTRQVERWLADGRLMFT